MDLEFLRGALGRETLTPDEAERLMSNPACTAGMNEAARLYYGEGLSMKQVAERQNCTRGPVMRRLRVWKARAQALLEER